MKACFIFSPFSSPAYIPSGISYLKSFIRKKIPSVEIKNLDLSENFCVNLGKNEFTASLPRLCLICPEKGKKECNGIFRNEYFPGLVKTALAAKSSLIDAKTGCFYSPQKYNRLIRLYMNFYREVISCINRALKAFLQEEKNKAAILESCLFKDDLGKILSENPSLIGLSVFSSLQLYYSLALAKILKGRTNARIVLGGAYISHLDTQQILELFDFIDFIIYKEGELGICGLIRGLEKERFQGVPNLVYKNAGKVIKNRESAALRLDGLAPADLSDYNLHNYFCRPPVLSVIFSRGCFWGGCTFCAHHKTYSNPYRTKPIPEFMLELKHYRSLGINHVFLADEAISAQDLYRLSKALIKERINMYFGVTLRPTPDFTSEILRAMYKAGFRFITWGVESFSQKMLDLMNKGTRAEKIEGILRAAYKIGFTNAVYLMVNFPGQTPRDILKDKRFLMRNTRYIYDIGIHKFWLEADTLVYRYPEKFGLTRLKKDCLLKTKKGRLFSHNISFVSRNNLSAGIINSLTKQRLYRRAFCDLEFLYSKEHALLHVTCQGK